MTTFHPDTILSILDRCCAAYSFPMLDNGYVYPAAARMSLFRSLDDWALVIETFGYSVRAGLPDTTIQTFASRLHERDRPENYVTRQAFENYLRNNPNNEYRSAYPLREGPWQDPESCQYVATDAEIVHVRDNPTPLPPLSGYAEQGIVLEKPPRVQVHELCRYLAAVARDRILATPQEQRVSVLPEMECLLTLDDWRHPDLIHDELPGEMESFQQFANVLATGDVSHYHPTEPPNTHWRNWPTGGTL